MGKDIEDIIDAIVRAGKLHSVILFGSRGRGNASADSDVDIAVLFDHLERNSFEVARSLRMKLLDVTTLPIDLLVYEASDFRLPSSKQLHNQDVS